VNHQQRLTVAHGESTIGDPSRDKASGVPQRVVQTSQGTSMGGERGLENTHWCTGDVDPKPETLRV